MNGKVDEAEKVSRLSALQALQKEITLKKNRSIEGTVVEVLVEGFSKKGKLISGRTPTNKIVNFTYNNDSIGRLVNVLIERSTANSLKGKSHMIGDRTTRVAPEVL